MNNGYWSSFRTRLLNKILILLFAVILFLWILGRVEFHDLPSLAGGSEKVSKSEKKKNAKKTKDRSKKGEKGR
jgi:hypothetical protein